MSYTNVFSEDSLPPSDVGLAIYSITDNTSFSWPSYASPDSLTLASIVELSGTGNFSLTLPPAEQVSVGESVLFLNTGATTFSIKNTSGVEVLSLVPGASYLAYVKDNATAAGVWGSIAYGAGVSKAAAGSLAGNGLKALSNKLAVEVTAVTLNSAYTLLDTNRAKVLLFTGGATTLTLAAINSLSSNFFCHVKNNGTGTLTLSPSGGNLIDGSSSLTVQPAESCILMNDNANSWVTVGLGRSTIYQYSNLTLDVSAGGTFTLTSTQASNKLLKFVGNPTADVDVVVPPVVSVYYLANNLSTAHSVQVKTAANPGALVDQTQRIVVVCDGSLVMPTQSSIANSALSVLDGSESSPSLNFASKTNTGLFKHSTQGLGFSVNGVAQLVSDGAGVEFPLGLTQDGRPFRTSATGSNVLSTGTTLQRDTSPTFGMLRGNTDLSILEYWNGIDWSADLLGPGLASNVIYEPAGSGVVASDAQRKLRESVSINDYMTAVDRDANQEAPGSVDVTYALQAAFGSTATDIELTHGRYRVVDAALDGSPVLTSAVAGRRIHGPGVITATTQVKKLLLVTGDDTTVSINVDGNLNIGYAIECTADRPTVTGCYIHDLDGKTNWGGVAIRLNFGENDYGGTVSHNRIENLQGVGDGNAGNGAGMQRAILVQTGVNCAQRTLITGNLVNGVWGEEGDSIVIQGGTASDPKRVPAIISNNIIKGWSRRAVKVAANGVSVVGNFFTNPLAAYEATLQRVVDATAASDFLVQGNTFKDCYFQPQITVYLNSPQVGNNITIKDNVISGSGFTDNGAYRPPIIVRSYGTNITVQGNVIDWPDLGSEAINVTESAGVRVFGNLLDTYNITWFNFTNSTDVRIGSNTCTKGGGYQSYYDYATGFLHVDASQGNKGMRFYNRDNTTGAGDTIAQIACMQNDVSAPNATLGSIRFVSEGTAGQTAVGIFTGAAATPDVEKLRISNSGTIRPGTDNTQTLGSSSYRWSVVYAGTGMINTSDAREKQDIREIDERERAVAVRIKGLLRAFRFRDAVESKGDGARIHFGVIAQEVKAAFESEGLGPFAYALLCYDEWPEQLEVKDEEGRIVQAYRPAGNRYGVRYEELLAFIISAL